MHNRASSGAAPTSRPYGAQNLDIEVLGRLNPTKPERSDSSTKPRCIALWMAHNRSRAQGSAASMACVVSHVMFSLALTAAHGDIKQMNTSNVVPDICHIAPSFLCLRVNCYCFPRQMRQKPLLMRSLGVGAPAPAPIAAPPPPPHRRPRPLPRRRPSPPSHHCPPFLRHRRRWLSRLVVHVRYLPMRAPSAAPRGDADADIPNCGIKGHTLPSTTHTRPSWAHASPGTGPPHAAPSDVVDTGSRRGPKSW